MTLVSEALAAPLVWVVLAESGAVHLETANDLKAALTGTADVRVDRGAELFAGRGARPDLIVTVGTAALDGALEQLPKKDASWSKIPLIATLVPQSIVEARRAIVGSRPFAAVVLDQPLARQLALIRRALPESRRVGVLPGPLTRPRLAEIEKEAHSRGLQLVVGPAVRAAEDIYPSLKEVLISADVVLALPDPLIYNAGTLQNILLTTYRARVPLVAFSSAYVKAGALLAVYSSPSQVARQTAKVVRDWLRERKLSPIVFIREFTVVANDRVAASLGLPPFEVDEIAADLHRLEAGQ
ncbi:ABC transporter substrate-binding protein [Sulfuricystis multivorans]|uniref:ABC transporter substrate-binding protein n=1 Tax=Sulfuricystis multivorans TaxID=2211108 RepID=UPI0015595128|nr:ABC transporter substrate binding protein [Sulfuricystis multivorans]